MKQITQKYQGFGGKQTSQQLYQNRKDQQSAIRSDKKHGVINNMRQWLADRDFEDAHPKQLKVNTNPKVTHRLSTPAHRRGRGEGVRSSQNSGDGNSNSEDPEPERRIQPSALQLYDQASLADLLCISKKTLQNQFSKTPHLLPPAISVSGARGPRWTPAAVQAWLFDRPAHSRTPASRTPAPAVVAPARNKVGRPRIALMAKEGVRS